MNARGHWIIFGLAIALMGCVVEKPSQDAIHRAAGEGDVDRVKTYLRRGVDPNARDRGDLTLTPLHWAAGRGRQEVAEVLLDAGADVNAVGRDGGTPLHIAVLNGSVGTAKLLISRGAVVNATSETGWGALHLAANKGYVDLIRLLLANGAEVDLADVRDYTPLHFAARHGHRDAVELLLANGADVHAENDEGKTALQLALDRGHESLVEILKRHGASPLNGSNLEGATSYTEDDRLVATYFFYWYNAETGEHIKHHDGRDYLTDHPKTLEGFTYTAPAWHRNELEDMLAAGIDIVLPVFWGCPECEDWSYVGLRKMVEACDDMIRDGITPPKIGMFYDTSTLEHNKLRRKIDLTTESGREWFYSTIRGFFALVPPKYWAMINEKPLVLLYAASFAADYDQACFDALLERFRRDFAGREPYVVKNPSWRKIEADNVCAWGAANGGCLAYGFTAIGPGYDHSAVVPPREPLIVDREDGAYYERNWQKALASPGNFVVIETWNELHEGTDICETKEYGRQYIELTAKYSRMFHNRVRLSKPEGPYSGAQSVSVILGPENEENGLAQVESADGVTAAAEIGGMACRKTVSNEYGAEYFYLRADDSFVFAEKVDLKLEVEFYDAANGAFLIEYDGADPKAGMGGAYTLGKKITMKGSSSWRTEKVILEDVWFANRQNAEADFRLAKQSPELFLRRVTLRRK